MCYSIPGRVVGFKEKKVIVDYFGERRFAHNEFKEIKLGDYIYAHGGFVIDVLPEEEAKKTLDLWKESFFELRRIDLRLSRLDEEYVSKKTASILNKALKGRRIEFDELLYLLSLNEEKEINYLYKTANFLRSKFHKNACCVHGIIEFSNYCKKDCLYCGIRKNNRGLSRYRMDEEEILKTVKEAVEIYGFKALVLQSGEDPYYDVEKLSWIIKKIRENYAVLIFISFGETGLEGLKKFYSAGARGILLRFETGNPKIYSKFHPEGSLERRIGEIKLAKEIGFLILTGGLIGLPFQTHEDILNDIFLAKGLKPEMYTFGPFIPQTPLGKTSPPPVDLVLKTISILRIIDNYGKIVVTTALETLDKERGRERGFLAGANSVMLNLTPEKYRSLYRIYPDRIHQTDSINFQIEKLIADLQRLGRAPTDLGLN